MDVESTPNGIEIRINLSKCDARDLRQAIVIIDAWLSTETEKEEKLRVRDLRTEEQAAAAVARVKATPS